jgi:hypothetical protein
MLGHRDLDLRVLSGGPKNADALNATFRSNNHQLFLSPALLPAAVNRIGAAGAVCDTVCTQAVEKQNREKNCNERHRSEI